METRRVTISARLRALFEAKPGCWLDGMEIAKVAGCYGWRTRCSELRVGGMDIRNRQQRLTDAQGRRWTISEYCYIPPKPDSAYDALSKSVRDEWEAVFGVAERREGNA